MEAPRSSSTGLRHRSNPARVTAQSVRRALTDDASEFSSAEFERSVERMGARHLFIRAGRSQTNWCVDGSSKRSWMSAGSQPSPGT